MLFRTLLSLLTAILSAQAFTLPAIIKDGIYSVRKDNSVEIHEKISALPPSAELKSKRTTKSEPATSTPRRDVFYWEDRYCGCGINLNHQDTDDAVATFKGQLDDNIHNSFPANYSFYVVRGSVVAFSCSGGNYGSLNQGTSQNYAKSLAKVTQSCGWYVAGTFSEEYGDTDVWFGWSISYDQGYMAHYPSLDFCTMARSSSSHSC